MLSTFEKQVLRDNLSVLACALGCVCVSAHAGVCKRERESEEEWGRKKQTGRGVIYLK